MKGSEHTCHITTEQAHAFERHLLRHQFQAMPEPLRRQTIARVRLLLKAERARGQKQPSALRRLASSVYGIQEHA